jgi:hypothetical protein
VNQTHNNLELRCALNGIGAWGLGFDNWLELKNLLSSASDIDVAKLLTSTPKPEIIPANERRRAPLPVKAAVDVSWQALQQSGIAASEVACVFGSGLGDTDITDYMCRTLTTVEKQLSPTKFHNSVHNAAAGYWTISTHCMKSANSIAGYQMTAALALLEGISQCVLQNEPVLITLFDTAAHDVYRQIFSCEHSFAAALLVSPLSFSASNRIATLTLRQNTLTLKQNAANMAQGTGLEKIYDGNPAAKILSFLNALNRFQIVESESELESAQLALSPSGSISVDIEAPVA